jgi:ribosome-binding factor A
MSIYKKEKITEQIKQVAAEFVQGISSGPSLITITDANVSKDFKRSTVFFTTLPEDQEVNALNFLKRKRKEFREYFISKTSMRKIPFFDFDIDTGEKNRRRIDELTEEK